MDDISRQLMADLIGACDLTGCLVLDVGSYDVNGTLRPLVEGLGGQYVGCDVREGPNVDVVVSETVTWHQWLVPVFDVVVCANALHNMRWPWRVVGQMARVLVPGGLFCLVGAGLDVVYPSNYPADYYRFTPNGLRALVESAGALRVQHVEERSPHVGVVAWKVGR